MYGRRKSTFQIKRNEGSLKISRVFQISMAVISALTVLSRTETVLAQDQQETTNVASVAAVRQVARIALRGAQSPEEYTFAGSNVQLWVFIGPESAVGSATEMCNIPEGGAAATQPSGNVDQDLRNLRGPEALRVRLGNVGIDRQIFLMNSGSANSPNLTRSQYLGFCAFRTVGGVVEYVPNLATIGITDIRVIDQDGRDASLSATNLFSGWLQVGTRSRQFQMPGRQLYNLSTGRWQRAASASIRFAITPPGDSNVAMQVPLFMRMNTQLYPHFSIALANSYGFAFGDGGRALAMPLTFAAGFDWLPVTDSSRFIGFRAIVAPAFTFQGGSVTQVTAVAFGARIDFDEYIGVGGGAQVNIDGDVKGIVFVSIGPSLLSVLTRR